MNPMGKGFRLRLRIGFAELRVGGGGWGQTGKSISPEREGQRGFREFGIWGRRLGGKRYRAGASQIRREREKRDSER